MKRDIMIEKCHESEGDIHLFRLLNIIGQQLRITVHHHFIRLMTHNVKETRKGHLKQTAPVMLLNLSLN